MAGEARSGLLKGIDTRTKVLALVCLIAEALFLGSLATLPSEQTLYALITCAVILVVMIVGIVFLEFKGTDSREIGPRPEPIDDDRQKAIVGRWRGDVHQRIGVGGKSFQQTLEITLAVDGDVITGEFIDAFNDGTRDHQWLTSVEGEFFYASFLKLHYRVRDRTIIQFGTMLLELSRNGMALDGKFVGFGATTRQIITGTINLVKA